MTIVEALHEFINSPSRNEWLISPELEVYVRKGLHAFDGQIINTFDIANIQDAPADYKGKGHFKQFMLAAEATGLPVYVECIHNPKLTNMLEKNGYTIININSTTHAVKFPN